MFMLKNSSLEHGHVGTTDEIGHVKGLQKMQDILMTFAVNSPDGYTQGMSDVLSPLLVMYEDEVTAYWAFERLMLKIVNFFIFLVNETCSDTFAGILLH
jgi:hypothetical protein